MDKQVITSTANTTMPFADQGNTKQQRRKERSMSKSLLRNRKQVFSGLALATLWIGFLGGGYALANHYIESSHAYIDQRLAEVKSNNEQQLKIVETQIQDLKAELGSVQEGLSSIHEELQLTGETLGGADQTKQALTTRIDQLNKQLGELKSSLKKLEDAARAW